MDHRPATLPADGLERMYLLNMLIETEWASAPDEMQPNPLSRWGLFGPGGRGHNRSRELRLNATRDPRGRDEDADGSNGGEGYMGDLSQGRPGTEKRVANV